MTNLKDKKEFIYLLDGKYYLIGTCACEEVVDPELLEQYAKYNELTQNDEFEYDVRKMRPWFRDEVGQVFDDLLLACHVDIGESRLDEKSAVLRKRLEENYRGEIENQLDTWLKADLCAFYTGAKTIKK